MNNKNQSTSVNEFENQRNVSNSSLKKEAFKYLKEHQTFKSKKLMNEAINTHLYESIS